MSRLALLQFVSFHLCIVSSTFAQLPRRYVRGQTAMTIALTVDILCQTENSFVNLRSLAPCPHLAMATGSLGAHVDMTNTTCTDPSRTVPDGPTRGQFAPQTSGANKTRREPYGEQERDSQASLHI